VDREKQPLRGAFAFAKAYFSHRQRLLDILDALVESGAGGRKQLFPAGSVLVEEGEPNRSLYILTSGQAVVLRKGSSVVSGVLGSGSFAGLVSFITGEQAFATIQATTDCDVIAFTDEEIELLGQKQKRFQRAFQQLVIANLVDRYQNNIELSEKLNDTAMALEAERDHLQQAYQELEKAHHRLVQQEKMAMLGQLVAGIAHELNNPIGALLQANLELGSLASKMAGEGLKHTLLEAGLQSDFIDTGKVRDRMRQIEEKHGIDDRTRLRKLATLPDELVNGPVLKQISDDDSSIAFFETGRIIKQISIISDRVANLVKSLKSYSRQDNEEVEDADINDGIRNTILILGNRLKHRSLEVQLGELHRIRVHSAELNQVWTNIIVNACDATEEGARLLVCTCMTADGVQIVFEDSGPGVPEAIREKIFEANFTTKSNPSNFGLGLGLAISKSIVEKHGGNIEVERSEALGGARFRVILPLKTPFENVEST
jgi:signal transduction histidine kinase